MENIGIISLHFVAWGTNLKLKIDYKSIKFKEFLYFLVFAATLMAALWILQVFLLNTFYGTMKTSQTKEVAREIESSFKHKNTDNFLNDVARISKSYDMYIYVVSYDGKTTYYQPSANDVVQAPGFEPAEPDNQLDEDQQMQFISQIQTLNEHMMSSNGSAYVKIKGTNSSQEILAYGSILTSKKKDPMIVYIFSPLWPVTSTIKILKNQLIYVTIISFLLACIISLYLSTRITRPIRKINNSAKQLAAGKYGIVFQGGHYTELVNLADTLTKASIELEKSDMMQKDLIANVSHDLKTPLTMIKSYAEMIRDISGDNPEKREEHLNVIIEEADRLNVLVNDLLQMSRLQSGKLSLEKAEFNLTQVVENILHTYRIMENEDGYHFEFQCNTDYYVNADEEKIVQVITNLFTNAIKFCGDDKTVIISLKKRGRNVVCRVEDHGIGIAPEEIDHVWERYYRSSSNMKREKEGTGLGLSICKEILTLHKSKFGVDSTVGKGSQFWFELECVRTEKRNA